MNDKEGPKDMEGKPEWAVLPYDALEHVVKVFEFGASNKKYGQPFTYRAGITYSKLFSATIRHLLAWWQGETLADDSKCHHLAHACANCLMLLSMMDKTQYDNRDVKTIDS
jgi:hypothetical protein